MQSDSDQHSAYAPGLVATTLTNVAAQLIHSKVSTEGAMIPAATSRIEEVEPDPPFPWVYSNRSRSNSEFWIVSTSLLEHELIDLLSSANPEQYSKRFNEAWMAAIHDWSMMFTAHGSSAPA